MRLITAAASILAVGLVAACGGESTPAPGGDASQAPAASAAADASPAANDGASPAAETAYLKTAQQSSEGDPAAAFPLVAGRYRMQWNSTDCEQVDILVSQVDGDFSYPKPSRSSYATATINDLPQGSYTIEQLDPACAEWQVRVDWMTN